MQSHMVGCCHVHDHRPKGLLDVSLGWNVAKMSLLRGRPPDGPTLSRRSLEPRTIKRGLETVLPAAEPGSEGEAGPRGTFHH